MPDAGLVGVIIGAAALLSGSFGAKAWDEWRQRSAVRAAFRAEIAGLLRVAEMRQHEKNFQALLDLWRQGVDHRIFLFGFEHGLPEDPVYSRNVDRIGVLGSQASDVVAFYTSLHAIRVTLNALASGRLYEVPLDRRIPILEQNLELWRDTKLLAEGLVKRL